MAVPHRNRNRTEYRNKIRKKSLLAENITDFSIRSDDVGSIIRSMSSSGGFESRNLATGINILRTMRNDSKCTRFLSFVAAIISTGTRGIIRDMLKDNMFQCVITTCGALDHDIARTYEKYFSGEFEIDDSLLHNKKIHRLGNVLIPNENYGPLIEKKMQKWLTEMYRENGTKNFLVLILLNISAAD